MNQNKMNEEENKKLALAVRKGIAKAFELGVFWIAMYGFARLHLFEFLQSKYFSINEDWFIGGVVITSIFILIQDYIYHFFGWYRKYSK